MSLGALLAVFLAAAAVTWLAGLYLSRSADVLDARFGLGEAVGGLLLLGLAGSLPELAITVSAALSGELDVATGNLLGGIAMQTLVLALLDATSRRRQPLSSWPWASPMLEASLVVVLVGFAVMGGLLPESTAIGPMSPMSLAIVAFFVLGVVGINRARRRPRWLVRGGAPPEVAEAPNRLRTASTRSVLCVFGVASLATLVAGVALQQTGNAIAGDLGMNGLVFGATILAAVTALPETRAASSPYGSGGGAGDERRLRRERRAAHLLRSGGPARGSPGPGADERGVPLAGRTRRGGDGVAIYGLLVRPTRKVAGLGPDSLAILVVYVVGIALLTSVPG